MGYGKMIAATLVGALLLLELERAAAAPGDKPPATGEMTFDISFDTCASGHSILDGCSTPSFPVNFSTAGSKDTTGVKGTTDVKGTSATTTTAVKATTDVNGTSGGKGATGSVSGNDETPALTSCAKVVLGV